MKILFCRSRAPLSVLIRWMTWSSWSHVALVTPEGVAYEATGKGVSKGPIAHLVSRYQTVEVQEVRIPAPDKVIAFLEAQLGKPYDFSALFGFMFRRDWAENDKWFCSELVASALLDSGIAIVCKPTNRITPQDLYESTTLRSLATR